MKDLRCPNRHSPDFVLAGVQATRIRLEGQRAVGVEFVQDGQQRELRAQREVLLSSR